MGLFSKEVCHFCGKDSGALSRKKLQDKEYICKDCEKGCSAFLEASAFDSEYMIQHMEYMKKQDELYRKEFEPLNKSEKKRIVNEGFYGIVFADSIAMFEIIDPQASKKNVHELFRYDQIKEYDMYVIEENKQTGKKGEVGVDIILNCRMGLSSLGKTEGEMEHSHPYCENLRIIVDKSLDKFSQSRTSNILIHLDNLFDMPSRELFKGIKESFVGNAHDKKRRDTINSLAKGLGGLAKAKISGDTEVKEKASQSLEDAKESGINYITRNRDKYKKIADEAEKRAWGE